VQVAVTAPHFSRRYRPVQQGANGSKPLGLREFYRAFELVGAITREEDHRHMGLDDLDRLDCGLRGRRTQEIGDIALIVGHCQAGTAASLLVQIAGKSGDK
jgi:hypothetical protein